MQIQVICRARVSGRTLQGHSEAYQTSGRRERGKLVENDRCTAADGEVCEQGKCGGESKCVDGKAPLRAAAEDFRGLRSAASERDVATPQPDELTFPSHASPYRVLEAA